MKRRVAQKEKFAVKAGIESEVRRFDNSISEEEILDESLTVDMEDVKHGHFVTDNGARKYDAEMEKAMKEIDGM